MVQDSFLDLEQIILINYGNLFQYQKQIRHMKENQLIFSDLFVEKH